MAYLHIILTWFSSIFTKKLTIAVNTHLLSVNYFGITSLCILITQYVTNDLMTSCLQIILFSKKYIEYSVSLDFPWKATFLKIGFIKLSFHIFLNWNYQLFYFCNPTYVWLVLQNSIQSTYVQINKWKTSSWFRSMLAAVWFWTWVPKLNHRVFVMNNKNFFNSYLLYCLRIQQVSYTTILTIVYKDQHNI